jgi:hypothetical protein
MGLRVVPDQDRLGVPAEPLKSLQDLKDRALAVPSRRAGESRANCVNRLAAATNYPADVALSQLQPKDGGPAVRNLRQHHVIRKFNQLVNDEFEEFPHA